MSNSNTVIHDLSGSNVIRPYRIEWVFNYNPKDLLAGVASKTTRKALGRFEEALAAYNLSFKILELQQDGYLEWLVFYNAVMKEQGHDILAKPEWWQTAQERRLQLFILKVFQAGNLVGAGIFSSTPEKKWVFNFNALHHIELTGQRNISLGLLMEHMFMKYAHKQGASIISSGKSRNAFGFSNSFGYLNFKTKFGYIAHKVESAEKLHTVESYANTTVGFFGYIPDRPDDFRFYLIPSESDVSSAINQLQYLQFTKLDQ